MHACIRIGRLLFRCPFLTEIITALSYTSFRYVPSSISHSLMSRWLNYRTRWEYFKIILFFTRPLYVFLIHFTDKNDLRRQWNVAISEQLHRERNSEFHCWDLMPDSYDVALHYNAGMHTFSHEQFISRPRGSWSFQSVETMPSLAVLQFPNESEFHLSLPSLVKMPSKTLHCVNGPVVIWSCSL